MCKNYDKGKEKPESRALFTFNYNKKLKLN